MLSYSTDVYSYLSYISNFSAFLHPIVKTERNSPNTGRNIIIVTWVNRIPCSNSQGISCPISQPSHTKKSILTFWMHLVTVPIFMQFILQSLKFSTTRFLSRLLQRLKQVHKWKVRLFWTDRFAKGRKSVSIREIGSKMIQQVNSRDRLL